MAITVDSLAVKSHVRLSNFYSFPKTVAGSTRLLVVLLTIYENPSGADTATSVKFNGVALTKAGTVITPSNVVRSEIWYLVAPDTGAHFVEITFPNALNTIVAAAVSFNGVDQTTPVGTYVSFSATSSAAPTVNATSAADELVLDVLGVSSSALPTPTVGAGQTQLWDEDDSINLTSVGSTEPGAASVTMSWSLAVAANVALSALPLKAAADPEPPIAGAPSETYIQTIVDTQDVFSFSAGNPGCTSPVSSNLAVGVSAGPLQRRMVFRFPLAALPRYLNPSDISLILNVASVSGLAVLDIVPLDLGAGDAIQYDCQTLFDNLTSAVPYVSGSTTYQTTGIKTVSLGALALQHLANLRAAEARYFSVALIDTPGLTPTKTSSIEPLLHAGTNEPKLQVTFSVASVESGRMLQRGVITDSLDVTKMLIT